MGYFVFNPLSENCPYDLICDSGKKLYRIQVKYRENGIIPTKNSWADRHGSHMNYINPADFDYFALYSKGKICFPPSSFIGKTIVFELPLIKSNKFFWWEDFQKFDMVDYSERVPEDFNIPRLIVHRIGNKNPRPEGRKVARPSAEELEKLLWEMPTIQIGKMFGVSDSAVAKWAKSYKLSKPPRGYWEKLESNINKPTKEELEKLL